MSLSDAAKGPEESGDHVAVTVHVQPLDPVTAASRLLKAIHAKDAEGVYDAYCLLAEAHKDRMERAGTSSDPGGDEEEPY